mmetsp:Transcript_38330/g.90095  ORF Transcript_38330/g.90095 Transcript_38330/m.90095 type:complete len:88 (+) Transcript_38330:1309-1572(+)
MFVMTQGFGLMLLERLLLLGPDTYRGLAMEADRGRRTLEYLQRIRSASLACSRKAAGRSLKHPCGAERAALRHVATASSVLIVPTSC